jgi:predicted glutamine amidotransferase
MCRLLYVESTEPFDIASHLLPFSQSAKASKEYQGHGWGCSWVEDDGWKTRKNIRPIWEDDFGGLPKTKRLLGHARSAFRNEGIAVENNMPFGSGGRVFAFNGELQGVRIREEGRIGAEKIFNLILRLDQGDASLALKRAVDVIEKRTRYVRAMNVILADAASGAWIASVFNEDSDYFTMHVRRSAGVLIVASDPYPGEGGWEAIPNRTIGAYTC